jgi:hypothetical protein
VPGGITELSSDGLAGEATAARRCLNPAPRSSSYAEILPKVGQLGMNLLTELGVM